MTSGADMPAAPVPPLWAQSLLSSVLPLATAESVSGDLLEEYRDAIVPACGKRRADIWYLRQLAGFLWRATWMFIVLHAALLIVRSVADVFAPPGFAPQSYQLRASLSTWSAISTFLLAGIYGGYRTGQSSAGLLTAFVASAAGYALAIGVGLWMFFAIIQPDPVKLDTFYITGGWGEEFGLPIIITGIACALGLVGGVIGKSIAGLAPVARSR